MKVNTSPFSNVVTTMTSSSACTATYVTTSTIMSAKSYLPYKSFSDLSDEPSRKNGNILVLYHSVFPVMQCEVIFSSSWPPTLLLVTPCRRLHVLILLRVIAPAHQLIASGFLLPFPALFIIGHLRETGLLHLLVFPGLAYLPIQPALFHLCD